jgi:transcription elongation factor Elf1
MIEEDYPFSCPHCGVDLSVRLDASGGAKQEFIQDCEVCCRPIQIQVRLTGDEVIDFSAETGE